MSAKRNALIIVGAFAVGVVVLLAGGIVYVNYFSPAAPFLAGIRKVATARALERQIANRAEYGAPADGQVSDDQPARFVKVEERVAAALGDRIALLGTAAKALEQREKEDRGLTVLAALKEIGAVGSLLQEAKRVQVEGLNAENFSKSEFEWVRHRLYAAAGVDFAQLDLKGLATFQTPQDLVDIRRSSRSQPPPETKILAERHAENLRRWRPLAFFGL